MPNYTPNPGTVRVDVFQHTGLVVTQAPSGDIAQLVGDFGGDSNVLAFYDGRISGAVTGTNPVTQLTDARGGSFGYTLTNGGSGNVVYNSALGTFAFNSNWLNSAALSALDVSTGIFTMFCVGYDAPLNSGAQTMFSIQNGLQIFGVGFEGVSSPSYELFTPQSGGAPLETLGSTQVRLLYLNKGAPNPTTYTGGVLSDDINIQAALHANSGNGTLYIGNNSGSNSSMIIRAAILLNITPSVAQLNFMTQWAIAKHGANIV